MNTASCFRTEGVALWEAHPLPPSGRSSFIANASLFRDRERLSAAAVSSHMPKSAKPGQAKRSAYQQATLRPLPPELADLMQLLSDPSTAIWIAAGDNARFQQWSNDLYIVPANEDDPPFMLRLINRDYFEENRADSPERMHLIRGPIRAALRLLRRA